MGNQEKIEKRREEKDRKEVDVNIEGKEKKGLNKTMW